jgi:hypothetical protein
MSYSFELVMNCIQNELLPKSIRTAYVLLMIRLWIDRHPHYLIRSPEAVRLFANMKLDVILGQEDKSARRALPQYYLEEGDPLRKDPDPFYHLDDMRKMRLLKVRWWWW